MGELGDKVDADAKAKLEEKRLKLKEATEKDDYDAMKTLLEELQQELYTVGASVYQQEGLQLVLVRLVLTPVPEPTPVVAMPVTTSSTRSSPRPSERVIPQRTRALRGLFYACSSDLCSSSAATHSAVPGVSRTPLR